MTDEAKHPEPDSRIDAAMQLRMRRALNAGMFDRFNRPHEGGIKVVGSGRCKCDRRISKNRARCLACQVELVAEVMGKMKPKEPEVA